MTFRLRGVRMIVVLALVAGAVSAAQVTIAPHSSPAHADVSTGTAGLFVPAQGTVLDTRTGVGGVSGPVAANYWYPIQVAGQAGVPTTGVSSVQVSVSVLTPAATGLVKLAPNGTTDVHIAALTYTGNGGSISASSIVALAADGKIGVWAQTSVTLLVHVQGYYTAGNGAPAPGGYVPINPARLVDTRNGTGLAQAKLATGSTTAIAIGGTGYVPADASAVFVMFTAISTSSTAGYFSPYPAGTTRPANVSLNYLANTATILGAAVDLGTNGQFNFWVGPAGTAIDLVVDVIGYYTATPGTKGAFTPASTRVYDSRVAPNTQLAANSSRRVQVGGKVGVPLPGSGISALAISAQIVHSGTAGGYLALGPGDGRTAVVSSAYFSAGTNVRSDLVIVPSAGDGTVLLVNYSNDPVQVILDVEGWYSAVGSATPAGQTRTQEYLTLQADPSGGGSWVTFRYREGIADSAWAPVPPADVVLQGTTTHPGSWPVQKAGSPAAFPTYTWDAGATLHHGDDLVQVQACYGSSATDPNLVCSMASTVQLATHAFGDSYATEAVGPGTLSLLTGDYQISASDVAVPTRQGSLSIGRSLTTLAPVNPAPTDPSGIFGPGWTADLPGSDAGAADLTLVDHPAEGYLSFTDSDGSVSLYQATGPAGSYPVSYAGVDDAAADATTVTRANAGEIDLLDPDGTTTVWLLTGSVWAVDKVIEAGSGSTASYSRDTVGRVIRILGATPAGVSCTSPDTTPGCRSLTLAYGAVPVAGASSVTRLLSVTFHSYDPATAAMTAVLVAAYDYDSTGRLADSYDPRISPNLKTAYSYDGNGRLVSLTQPGLAPFTMTYAGNGRLATVSRYDASLAQTATNTIAYGVPFTGAGAPIDLGSTAVAAWGQTDLPVTATAVFGPNHIPAASPTSTDWPYATVHYLDINGRETNTASYGASNWQYGAINYDANGNPVSSLTSRNRTHALAPVASTDPAVAALTDPVARAALLSSTQLYDPLNPDQLVDSYGPAHPVVLANGSTIDGRSHTHTVYDQAGPTDGNGDAIALGLPTTVTAAAFDLAAGTDRDSVTTTTGYAAVAAGGSKTGWDLRQATSSTRVGAGAGGTDLVTNTRYNDAGQTVQSWLPKSDGADARSTSTSYYTATGAGPCVSAALAGLPCSTGPTAQPATGNPLPVTATSYNLYDQPVVVTETAGSTVRTTSTSYDGAGRPTGSTVAVTPTAAGGTVLPAVTTAYQTATGLPSTITADGRTLTTSYDSLGRVTAYTDATGNVATTSYDLSGRPVAVNDGKGTTTYSYDSATEHRGLVTSEDVGVGAAPGTFTGSYNADGALASQTYPNGLVATTRFDNTGDSVALTYTKGSTTWMTFTQASNAQGDTAIQTSPGSTQTFGYDPAGRLASTQDTAASSCTTRTYTLDNDSNRQVLKSFPAATGGGCSTTTTPATANSTFDDADRITNTGYGYDSLGRTPTVPAADAIGSGSHAATTGALTLGYYANDFVATQTQGGRSLGFTLDPTQNRVLDTTDTAGPTSTNHYTDSGDAPAWSSTGATNWTRNLGGIAGGLAATVDQAGTVTLQLVNLHGDIIATGADDPAATGPVGYSESTEYGAPRSAAMAPDSYGWLGTKQRSTNDLAGLTLMGVRLYNPATGRFLSLDPVPGGNDNPYAYPLNPTDQFDLDGRRCSFCHSAFRVIRQEVRNQINAPASSLAYLWAKGHGAHCKWNSTRGITVCSGMHGGYGRAGTTVGSVYMTGGRTDDASIRHEAKHANQWAWFGGGLGFPLAYGLEEYRSGGGRRNSFERQAGLHDGCYIRRPGC